MNRMVGQVCTVEVGIAAIKGNGVKCQRRAVLEITERGIHSGWRCALHATDWKDEIPYLCVQRLQYDSWSVAQHLEMHQQRPRSTTEEN